MKLAVISFTQNGINVSKRIAKLHLFENDSIKLFSKCSYSKDDEDILPVEESIYEWAEKNFEESDVLIFVGALAIAVRAISSCVKNKLSDIPVIVIDEAAEFVIPLLSGHVGGANELSKKIAKELGSKAVITTATDLNGRFAADVFAKKNSLFIVNKDGIKEVSSKILAGEKVLLSAPEEKIKKDRLPGEITLIEYPPLQKADILITDEKGQNNGTLILKPREYILGIGCKKDTPFDDIMSFINDCLADLKIELNDLYAIASIDLKKEEEALNRLSSCLKIPFYTFSAEELNALEGDFSSSDFVRKTTGTDNVCERAALLACGEGGKIVCAKKAGKGITAALAKRDWVIDFYE